MTDMALLLYILMFLFFIFLIGLCIGSFLNVVILRAFSNESIVFPGSKCPSCNTPLKWHHNIPLLSYLFLQGKCAYCDEKISAQYPLVELLTGLVFVAVFLHFGIGSFQAGLATILKPLFIVAFSSLFIVLAVTDIKQKVIFDVHAYILIALGLIFNLFDLGHFYPGYKMIHLWKLTFPLNYSLGASVLGILLGIAIMEVFARLGYVMAKTRAFGEGDTYIAAGIGAILGWKYLIWALALGFVIQIIFTIPVFIKKLYINSDFKTLGAFFIFFLLAFAVKWLDYAGVLTNLILLLVFTIVLCIVGFYVCKRILDGLKTQDDMTYLPFGPAMVIGAFFVLFFI